MDSVSESENDDIRKHKRHLTLAIEKRRSSKWILRLWSRYIKARDAYRCLCCEATQKVQAHHIVRRTRFPAGAFQTGNGITLCYECHGRVHAEFNGRPDPLMPLCSEQGDDQDEWSFLFGLARDDAVRRGLDEDEFYYLGDEMLELFVGYQGYQELHQMVLRKELSRIRFAHEIWRGMPDIWYEDALADGVALHLLKTIT